MTLLRLAAAQEMMTLLTATTEPSSMADNDLFASWSDLESEGTVAVTDNGGRTANRYTLILRDGYALTFGSDAARPQGFSDWEGEPVHHADIRDWIANGYVLVDDVQEPLQDHLLARINEFYRSTMDDFIRTGRTPEVARADIISDLFRVQAFNPAEQRPPQSW